MIIWTWIKRIGAKELVRELNLLVPLIASKLSEAQKKFGEIPPEQFAKVLVVEIQVKLCSIFKIDPKSIGISEE